MWHAVSDDEAAAWEEESFPCVLAYDKQGQLCWEYTCTSCGLRHLDPTDMTLVDTSDLDILEARGIDVMEAATVLCPTCALMRGYGVRARWRIFA